MLMAGIAVNSPADAALLHPNIFVSSNQAKLVLARTAFKGQNPMYDTYREMTLKSASYRLGGRGRGWQRAFWIAGSADDARLRLEAAVGPVAEWTPQAN